MRPAVRVGDLSFLPFAIEIVITLPNGYVFKRVDIHDDDPESVDTQALDCVEERNAETLKTNFRT